MNYVKISDHLRSNCEDYYEDGDSKWRRLVQSCNLNVFRQIVTNPSKRTYTFQKGYKGLINYYIK